LVVSASDRGASGLRDEGLFLGYEIDFAAEERCAIVAPSVRAFTAAFCAPRSFVGGRLD